MNIAPQDLALRLGDGIVTSKSVNFRPPSWPPPRDWPVVIDKNGVVVSRWGEPKWDLTGYAGKPATLNFGDGETKPHLALDPENADLLRMVATWLMWGPRAANAISTVLTSFSRVRQIFSLCSARGISAANLMRFPKVLDSLPGVLPPSKFRDCLALLQRLFDSRELLGFTIVDSQGLKRLAALPDDHDVVQTAYIPPRIWLYQLGRLRECLTEFIEHREQVEACFLFCLEAYRENFGSLPASVAPKKDSKRGPFNIASSRNPGCTYHGQFAGIAERFGILSLLKRWIEWRDDDLQVRVLSAYMSLVTFSGLAYIGCFTMQRKEEVASLRSSCLVWETDEKLGRVPLICGATTKTDSDSDARWVASPSVDIAVDAVAAIAKLRMQCERVNPLIHPSSADQEDPYLLSGANEPWGLAVGAAQSYDIRQPLLDYDKAVKRYSLLFDVTQMTITAEDLRLALVMTPNLPVDVFAIGKVWPLQWHQGRRTTAVNMFSGDISEGTMQQQMKHKSRLTPLYYGRNYTSLHLNREVQTAVMSAMYEAQAAAVASAVQSDRFFSPHSEHRKEPLVVQVLSAKDSKALAALAADGKISFRLHRLGGCMKEGVCEYGGIESVSRCAGGDGGKPCTDVLYDRAKEPQVRADLRRMRNEMGMLKSNQPRHSALAAECEAMENFLNAVTSSN